MERYYIDTNILVFMISGDTDNISTETRNILSDYNSQLNTSIIAVMELLQIHRIGKVKFKKQKTSAEIIDAIENTFNVIIRPFSTQHLETLAKLSIPEGHNDPFDHAIIAQALSEKMVLISSDAKFERYTKQKLKFAFNKR
jgi:tRNA(fMet)-specific endonuclease VapC